MHRLIVLVLVLNVALISAQARAQTPVATTCELTPLTLPLFGATPIAELATPQASPLASDLSEAEATEVLAMYVACTNTGDPTLVWAMFTPRWFSTQFADSEDHYLPAFEYEIATGNAPVTDPLKLGSVDAIESLPDGRVGVTATFSSANQNWTDQLILVNMDGNWLIDDVVLISPPN